MAELKIADFQCNMPKLIILLRISPGFWFRPIGEENDISRKKQISLAESSSNFIFEVANLCRIVSDRRKGELCES